MREHKQENHRDICPREGLVFVLLFAIFIFAAGNFAPASDAQSSAQNIVWTNIVNSSASGNTLQKPTGCFCFDSGAISQQQITATGSYVEFTPSTGHRLFVGLSTDTSNSADYSNINYAFNFWGDGTFDIREGWANWRAQGTYAAGDLFRIAIESGLVKYYKNGGLIYTSGVAPTYPLVMDTSLVSVGSTVNNAVISLPSTAGIKTDLGLYPEPSLPQLPAKGGKFFDPTFGTEIMRVTDQQDGQINGTYYAYWSSFNSNNTRLLVKRSNGDAIYEFNPQTFTLGSFHVVPSIPSGTSCKPNGSVLTTQGAIWSTTNPDILYGGEYGAPCLWGYNAATHTYSLVRNLTGTPGVASTDYLNQMSMSDDNDVFAFTQSNSADADIGYLVYCRSSNQVLLRENLVFNGATINEVQIDKSGRFLGVPLETADSTGKSYYIRDLQTGTVDGLTDASPDFSPGHGDLGTGMLIAFDNNNNRLLRRSMATPHQFSLVLNRGSDFTQGLHLSLRATDETWALIGFYSEFDQSQGVLHNELVQVKTDGSESVRRLAHHRSVFRDHYPATEEDDYWNTPRANISRDGKFIAFSSNWGASGRVDMFIVKIPPATGGLQNVVWTNIVNSSASGNTLQKPTGCFCFDSGAISQQQITATGSYVEFTPSTGHRLFAGLSTDTSSSTDYSSINYAFNFWGDGTFDIREGWSNWRTQGSYAAGDVFRIAIESGVVKYYKNGSVIYTSGVAPTYPLVMDTSLVSVGSTVNNAVIFRP